MKTAISIPDEIFEAAEELATDLGLKRSELYARAVAEYVGRCRDDEVTAKLNAVYATTEAQLDPGLDDLQRASLPNEDAW